MHQNKRLTEEERKWRVYIKHLETMTSYSREEDEVTKIKEAPIIEEIIKEDEDDYENKLKDVVSRMKMA